MILPEDFDPDWYSASYPDVAASGMSPTGHYMRLGALLGRPANRSGALDLRLLRVAPQQHKMQQETGANDHWEDAVANTLAHLPESATTILIAVGHDASQTGAPNILLATLAEISRTASLPMAILLRRGGLNVERFRRLAPTIVMSDFAITPQEEQRLLAEFLTRISGISDELLAIVNTADSVSYCRELKKADAHVITLIHETGRDIETFFGGPHSMREASDYSDQLIFPTEFALQSCSSFGLPAEKVTVVPYGLDLFHATSEKNTARDALRTALAVPSTARIITMVGSFEPRKGFDMFVEVALKVIQLCRSHSAEVPVFVWKGPAIDLPYARALIDAIPDSLSCHFRFQGPDGRAEQLIMASDVFFLSSREESTGLVALEAAAYGVPVCLFSGCTGAESVIPRELLRPAKPFDLDEMATTLFQALSCDTTTYEATGIALRDRLTYERYAREILGSSSLTHESTWPRILHKRDKILIIGYGPPPVGGARVEGTGLRNWGLAKGLTELIPDADVVLAFKVSVDAKLPEGFYEGIRVIHWEEHNIKQAIAESSVLIFSFCMGSDTTTLLSFVTDQVVVLDCYVPIYTEVAARHSSNVAEETRGYLSDIHFWNRSLSNGDYFLVANSAQEFYYRGILSSLGKLTPANYSETRILRVPYGIPSPPVRVTDDPVRALVRKEHRNSLKLLWFGAVYPWFNTNCLTAALTELRQDCDFCFIMVGVANPFVNHPDFVRKAELFRESVSAAGLHNIVYYQDWVPYSERANWYCNCDVIVTINREGVENELSWRTRLADYVWSGMPVATNGGDPLGEELINAGAAARLNIRTPKALRSSLRDLLIEPKKLASLKKGMIAYRPTLFWRNAVRPLANAIRCRSDKK